MTDEELDFKFREVGHWMASIQTRMNEMASAMRDALTTLDARIQQLEDKK